MDSVNKPGKQCILGNNINKANFIVQIHYTGQLLRAVTSNTCYS